jgi:hypothetical protein
MKKNERIVQYYDVSISARSRTFDAPEAISVKRALDILDSIPMEQRATRRGRGTQTFYISAWRKEGRSVLILINKSDQGIADPVFTIPIRGSRRTAAKRQEEGQDFSAHVLIKPNPDPLQPALMLVEQCPGLSGMTIGNLLSTFMRTAARLTPENFVQIHPDGSVDENGKPATYNVRFKFEVLGHPSEDFVNDLNRGALSSLELITSRVKGGAIDDSHYLVQSRASVVLKVSPQIQRPADLAGHVLDLITNKQKDYSTARLTFKIPNSQREQSVEIDAETGIPEKYIKRMVMNNFALPLEGSYANFNEEVVRRLLVLARAA